MIVASGGGGGTAGAADTEASLSVGAWITEVAATPSDVELRLVSTLRAEELRPGDKVANSTAVVSAEEGGARGDVGDDAIY